MKSLTKFKTAFLFFAAFSLFLTSCEIEEEIPTKTRMEAVWQVTEAYNQSGEDILADVSFPLVGFHLSSDNTIISSAGPMIMYIVYGDSKYTEIASKIDQVFNYSSLNFNGGEFFVGGGVQNRFTLEMKLEGLPGQATLTTLLDLLGITDDYWDVVIYHKFMDVFVEIDPTGEKMIWEFDDKTTAVYNTKDNYGNYILWNGWPVNNFSKSRFVFTKKTKDLKDLIIEHGQ
ncbi:MAG: hypothetical protein PHT69_14355 [Bacteroidales bacterium]|nr:hypothetical protein [Bacteroidales bacterium]